MEIFYFERNNRGVTRDYCRANCFFIPHKNILFVKENVNGVDVYTFVTDENIVDEARVLHQGKDPYKQERNGVIETVGTPSFSDTRKIEVSDDKINEILENLRKRDLHETKVKKSIEDILANI